MDIKTKFNLGDCIRVSNDKIGKVTSILITATVGELEGGGGCIVSYPDIDCLAIPNTSSPCVFYDVLIDGEYDEYELIREEISLGKE